jgi:hypothetical protein
MPRKSPTCHKCKGPLKGHLNKTICPSEHGYKITSDGKFTCRNQGCGKIFTTIYMAQKHSNSTSCKEFKGEGLEEKCPNNCGGTFSGMSAKTNALSHSKSTMCPNNPERKPDHKTTIKHTIKEDNTKWCNQCKTFKSIDEFALKDNVKNDTGLDYVCYYCRARLAMCQNTKERAKKEGHDPDAITLDLINSLIVKNCQILNYELQYGGDPQCNNSATIDAVIHELGHVPGNLKIISKRANTIKNNSTLAEMEKLVNGIENWKKPEIDKTERKRKAGKKTEIGQSKKICSLCCEEKNTEEFHKNNGTKAGISNRCIKCTSLSSMIKNAKQRNKNPVEINAWFLCQLAKNLKYCPILGEPLLFGGTGKLQDNSASIDRFDPSKGYTEDNVWIISHKANRMKSDANLEEIKKVYEYMKKYA